MDEHINELIKKLEKIETEVNKGNLKLKSLGFWKIVYEAKVNPYIAKILGKKIAEINKKVFDKRWKWKFRPILGIILLSLISIATIFFYFLVYYDRFLLSIYLPISSFILSASLHPVTQYITGRIFGIKFLYIYPRGIYIFHRSSKGRSRFLFFNASSTILGFFLIRVISIIFFYLIYFLLNVL